MTPETQSSSPLTLSDMIAALLSNPQPAKAKPKAKVHSTASPKATPSKSEAPINTLAEWKLSMRWKDASIVLTVSITQCTNCGSRESATQPFLMLQRYHPTFGFHSEAIALHDPKHDELPRRLVEVEQRAAFCRHCFLTNDTVQRQLRLFGSTDGIVRTPQGDMLLGLFPAEGAPRVAESTAFASIEPAGTSKDRAAVPSTLPFFAPLCITQAAPQGAEH